MLAISWSKRLADDILSRNRKQRKLTGSGARLYTPNGHPPPHFLASSRKALAQKGSITFPEIQEVGPEL